MLCFVKLVPLRVSLSQKQSRICAYYSLFQALLHTFWFTCKLNKKWCSQFLCFPLRRNWFNVVLICTFTGLMTKKKHVSILDKDLFYLHNICRMPLSLTENKQYLRYFLFCQWMCSKKPKSQFKDTRWLLRDLFLNF